MKTFLLNTLGLNESGPLADDRFGNPLILSASTPKPSVFVLLKKPKRSVRGIDQERVLMNFS